MSDAVTKLTTALEGRYRIERELGAGGMATVYLAHDERHDRKVALKVLRPELAAILGGERFLAEIKTTANLQHPHILPLHDSGEADGLVFYVMPYVEGESLRDRLARERQLPVEEALRIATEVADALEYAQQQGVIHRDIKPENILLHGGHALVADFGIALAASRSEGATRMTETGMSLGTPAYMSPEQAMGEREITPRADVYALGCVVYEMLSGEPPFVGPTAQAIIARVMTEEPRALTLHRHTIPPHVEAAVRKALEKLPADRFASAAQFAEALTRPGNIPMMAAASGSVASVGAARPSPAGPSRQVRWAIGVGALALAVLAGVVGRGAIESRSPPAAAPVARFRLLLPADAAPLGALGSTIALSPDGSRMVYIGRSGTGSLLYTRGLDQLDPVPIPGTEGASLPFFSPDGRWLGFKQGNRLAKVAVAGGPVLAVADAPALTFGATWGPGDTIVFASDSGLLDVPAAGGRARLVARPDTAHGEHFRWPEFLPGRGDVLFSIFTGSANHLAVLRRPGGDVRRMAQPDPRSAPSPPSR